MKDNSFVNKATRQDGSTRSASDVNAMGDCIIVSTMSHHDLHRSALETAPFG